MTLPRKTIENLHRSYGPGERHHALLALSIQLLGNGITPDAVFAQLRATFDAEKTDKEIRDVISWAMDKNPTPSDNQRQGIAPPSLRRQQSKPPEKRLPPREAARQIITTRTLEGSVEIPAEGATQLLLSSLYAPDEYLNIVAKFTTKTEEDGKIKCNPYGEGKTLTRDEWIEWIEKKGIPQSEAGCWFRPNPMRQTGTGKDGAMTDADVTSLRFLLLESDLLTVDEQIGIYAKARLPIAAIVASGGDSAHAWVRLDAKDSAEYRDKAARIYAIFHPFGFDQANKNPSRMSRLPGAVRKIGATGDGVQRVLYLCPDAKPITDEEIEQVTVRLTLPKFRAPSMGEAIQEAVDRYEEIALSRNTGIKTGFPMFDSLTGGLKPGWLAIIAGETNTGKTSFVLNIVMNALEAGVGVALFSFEMDMQEIIDIMFSRQAEVSRNKFNNAHFSNRDFIEMSGAIPDMQRWPLYCFDDPMMTIADVHEAAKRTHADTPLGLVVVDYLQLANSESFRDSREQQVAHVSRMSKALAKILKVPVIGVSQLNEDGKVRESRGIAHDANCIIKLVENENGTIDAKIIKGRSIPKGTFKFSFEREFCRFSEIDCDETLRKLIPQEPPHVLAREN